MVFILSTLRSHFILFCASAMLIFGLTENGHAQTLPAAARQVLDNTQAGILSIAIWPVEASGTRFNADAAAALSDEIEQAVGRKARELNLKIITRRQLEKVLREIKLTGSDFQDFNSLSKSNGVDAIVVTSVSFPKTTCMSVGLKLLGTSDGNKAEVINIAKPFLVKIHRNELDLTGCDD